MVRCHFVDTRLVSLDETKGHSTNNEYKSLRRDAYNENDVDIIESFYLIRTVSFVPSQSDIGSLFFVSHKDTINIFIYTTTQFR